MQVKLYRRDFNMKTITIKDVAKICGVGVTTVSRAINNHPDINEDTKKMILQVIKDNNYIPNNRELKRKNILLSSRELRIKRMR